MGHTKKKKSPVVWWWTAGAAALLLGIGVYKMSATKENSLSITKTENEGIAQDHNNETTNTKATEGTSDMKGPVAVEGHSNYNNGVIENNSNASSVVVNQNKTNISTGTGKSEAQISNNKTTANEEALSIPTEGFGLYRSFAQDSKLMPVQEAKLSEAVVLAPNNFSNALESSSYSIYDENAFPNQANLEKGQKKGLNKFIYSLAIGQMRSNLAFNGSANVYVHRDFYEVQKNYLKTVSSLEIEGFVGREIAANGWYTTIGLGVSQQASRGVYDFIRTPSFDDETLPEDDFGNYPIIGYLNFAQARVQFQTSQRNIVVGAPVGILKQTTLGSKWLLNTGFTVNPTFLVSAQGQTLNYNDLNQEQVKSNWYRKVMVGSSATIGLSKKVANGSIGLQLKGRAYPFSVYKVGSSVGQKPYDVGVSLQWIGGLTK